MKVKKAMKKWLLPAIAVILVLSYCYMAYCNRTFEYFRRLDYLHVRKELSLCAEYFLSQYEQYAAQLRAQSSSDSFHLELTDHCSRAILSPVVSLSESAASPQIELEIDNPEVSEALLAIGERMRSHRYYSLDMPHDLVLNGIFLDKTEVVFSFGYYIFTDGLTSLDCGSGLSYVAEGSEPHLSQVIYRTLFHRINSSVPEKSRLYRHLIGDWYVAKTVTNGDWFPRANKDLIEPIGSFFVLIIEAFMIPFNILFASE